MRSRNSREKKQILTNQTKQNSLPRYISSATINNEQKTTRVYYYFKFENVTTLERIHSFPINEINERILVTCRLEFKKHGRVPQISSSRYVFLWNCSKKLATETIKLNFNIYHYQIKLILTVMMVIRFWNKSQNELKQLPKLKTTWKLKKVVNLLKLNFCLWVTSW